ncbi:MAG: hypothetical protein KatS3mg003_1872 [Candidatus Nitrosocaldaceae archaeon]|nr:MAG: hypothetical protein KatS3mg003_1872 [Candidatus Nitrosocaldaceae archaeon]
MKYILTIVITTILIFSMTIPVLANHYGIHGYTKTSNGSLLYNTKVTAEKINFYDWKRSSSNTAYYSFNYNSGSTYLMASMKNGYGYEYDWNINPPATKDWFLSSRAYMDAKFVLITDQSFRTDHPNHETDAKTLTLDVAEPWFKEEHGIKLIKYVYKGDYIRTSTDCAVIGNDIRNKYPSSGAEVLLIIVGKHVSLTLNGESVLGCAELATGPGQYVWAVVKEINNDPGRLSMHEISHLYGLEHVRNGYGNPFTDYKTVMHKYFDDPMSIKNWAPLEDYKLELRRGWH